MFYISQEKVMSLHGYTGGRVLVRYYTFRGNAGFEVDTKDLEAALATADLLRRYDTYHEFHRKKASYSPFAEFMQMDEDGEWVCFGQVMLPGEPPWARPRKG